MIPRMTTVGSLKNYRYNLNRSNNTLGKAMNIVTSRRLFSSYAEDPALATRCFQIRHSHWRTETQLDINESLRHKYDVAWQALGTVSTDLYALAEDTALTSIVRGKSEPTGPGRVALGQSLMAKAKDMAQTMNGRYSENYVFAGADTLNAPFTWGPKKNSAYIPGPHDPDNPDHVTAFQYIDGNGKLTNTKADAALVPKPNPDYNEEFTKAHPNPTAEEIADPRYGPFLRADGTGGTTNPAVAVKIPHENEKFDPTAQYKYLKADGTGTNSKEDAAEVLYYRGVCVDSNYPEDVEKMEYFLNEERKDQDVGLGHKEANGDVVSSTVFDSALQGAYFLGGYGTKDGVEVKDEQGNVIGVVDKVPNNVISVVNELGEILQRCRVSDGEFASKDDELRFQALFQEFEKSTSDFRERWTEMDTQSGFLRDNSELLQGTADSLKQQYMELEDADPAAAISDFMFARYCYDAALKVGNSILSQSLMDYLNL